MARSAPAAKALVATTADHMSMTRAMGHLRARSPAEDEGFGDAVQRTAEHDSKRVIVAFTHRILAPLPTAHFDKAAAEDKSCCPSNQ